MISVSKISYFDYVTAKFCLLKDKVRHAQRLQDLNTKVASQIQADADIAGRDSEVFLLMSDYLSAPDISDGEKRVVLKRLIGGDNHSGAAIAEASRHLGFVDWSGVRIQYLLARKELRPVYAWA